jgi:hypothetical protein
MILSEKAVAVLAGLKYRPEAGWVANLHPLGSIVWNDEMPDSNERFQLPRHDMSTIIFMFAARRKLWDGKVLDAQEQQLWDAVKQEVPEWIFFRRLTLSDEEKAAREEADRQIEEEFDQYPG